MYKVPLQLSSGPSVLEPWSLGASLGCLAGHQVAFPPAVTFTDKTPTFNVNPCGGGEEEAWRLGDLKRRRGVGGRNDNSVNEAEGKKMWHLCSLSPEKVEISH